MSSSPEPASTVATPPAPPESNSSVTQLLEKEDVVTDLSSKSTATKVALTMQTMQAKSSSSLARALWKRNIIIADLYSECIKFYSMILRGASLADYVPRHIYRGLESGYSSLILWGREYGVADGGLDELFKMSRLLQSMTLEPLIRISETLRNRIRPELNFGVYHNDAYAKYRLFLIINEAKRVARTVQDGRQDPDGTNIASSLDELDLLDEDSWEDMVADIKIEMQCLLDLDSMYEYPVSDLENDSAKQHEDTSISQDWREGFVGFVHQQFPLAHEDFIQQLGWYLNGKVKVGYSASSKLSIRTILEKTIRDALVSFLEMWSLHKAIVLNCPLCGHNVEDDDEFFESHVPHHAEELSLLALDSKPDQVNKRQLTQPRSMQTNIKSLSMNKPSQSRKANMLASTKQREILHDEAQKETGDEQRAAKPSSSERPIQKTSNTAKSGSTLLSKKIYCELCNDRPNGFWTRYKWATHMRMAHPRDSIYWVCRETSPDKTFLAGCEDCRIGKPYTTAELAAAHLRRVHFDERQVDHGGVGEADDAFSLKLKSLIKEKYIRDIWEGEHSSEDENRDTPGSALPKRLGRHTSSLPIPKQSRIVLVSEDEEEDEDEF